jgi:L-rhamnose mutarotase
VVGYFETEDLEAAQDGMALREVNARWQAEMAEFFDGEGPDAELDQLTEVFHLETQLAGAESADADAAVRHQDQD